MSGAKYYNHSFRYFHENFEIIDAEEMEVSFCELENSKIDNRIFCENYEE